MQANLDTSPALTITERARRQQIVLAAISCIAERGFGNASFTRIAEQAGLSSTGLISYHFRGKRQLNAAIAYHVLDDLGAWVYERMKDCADPPAALEAYIRNLLAYMQERPQHLAALSELVLHGALDWDASDQQHATSALEEILRHGQAAGAFRAFDVSIMATTIQRSLDGIPFLQRSNPEIDLNAYGDELVETFRRATTAGTPFGVDEVAS